MQRLVFQLADYINSSMAEFVISQLVIYGNLGLDIDILIDSPGGSYVALTCITKSLKTYKKQHPTARIRAHIYKQAFSSAMYLVLCADEFYCTEYTLFGPVNHQLYSKANNFTVSNENIEDVSNIKTSTGELEATVATFNRLNPSFVAKFKKVLAKGPYSEHKDILFSTLYMPLYHHHPITLKKLESIGCKRAGPLAPDILKLCELNSNRTIPKAFLHPPLPASPTAAKRNISLLLNILFWSIPLLGPIIMMHSNTFSYIRAKFP